MSIAHNYTKVRSEIPEDVKIVLAAKRRSAAEIIEAIEAGATDFGQNYIQEAETVYSELGELNEKINWHFIGELQKNKINKALPIFDTFQTVDSLQKAIAINLRAERMNKSIEVYLEINSAKEANKAGLPPQKGVVEEVARGIANCRFLKLTGLMTMGAFLDDPEDMRPFFKSTKEIFDYLKSLNIPNVQMKTLSMGMSDSYDVAIEEGANMIRLGTIIFGPRL